MFCQFCSYMSHRLLDFRGHVWKAHRLIYRSGAYLTESFEKLDPKEEAALKGNSEEMTESVESTSDSGNALSDKELTENENVKNTAKAKKVTGLSEEEFRKKALESYEKFLETPEVVKPFINTSLEHLSKLPSFPKASPHIRKETVDTLYNLPGPKRANTASTRRNYTVGQDLSWVEQEVEVGQNIIIEPCTVPLPSAKSGSTTLKLIKKDNSEGDSEHMIMIDSNGVKSVVCLRDFYQTMLEAGKESSQILQVITALLEAGEEIEMREEEEMIEIQNV